MTRHPKARARAKRLRSLYVWHRYLGLSAALFVILLSVTGLALNHTESLRMDTTHIQSEWLLDWYGIHAPNHLSSYAADSVVFTVVNEQVFRDTDLLAGLSAPLVGAVACQDMTVVASVDYLALLSPEGELIESLGNAAGVPAGMQAIGTTSDGAIAIKTANAYYLTDESLSQWNVTDSIEANWSTASDTPPELTQALQAAYRGNGLTLERILLDLHSGRILGEAGVFLVDAAAIIFLLLASSGVWLWSRRRASAREHRRKLERRR